ncbi:MAG: MoxR family ATPase [Clostridiales bacterium]
MLDEKIISETLKNENFYIDDDLAMVVAMAKSLNKPMLLEGPAGVGKTDLARFIAQGFGMEFIRLQCYEGLDESHALYEWNYQKQLLFLESKRNGDWQEVQNQIFSQEFLLPRPLLKSFLTDNQAVLLIDEIDKSDEAFESFLLEALSDFAVTIPEWGTIKAKVPPMVFLTSNGIRDFSDGLKRRCVHYYIDYPTVEREMQIIKAKVPGIGDSLIGQICQFLEKIRKMKIKKKPSIAEALDWAQVLVNLSVQDLKDKKVDSTYCFLLKYQEDINLIKKL